MVNGIVDFLTIRYILKNNHTHLLHGYKFCVSVRSEKVTLTLAVAPI